MTESLPSTPILSGFKEPEEDDSALTTVLDSLGPNHCESSNLILLPIFLGKETIGNCGDVGSSSATGKGHKSFAWSRGIASDLSPIKTRSSRKKQVASSSQTDAIIQSSPDIGALRAMKALAREK